jgi:hypothetical protein
MNEDNRALEYNACFLPLLSMGRVLGEYGMSPHHEGLALRANFKNVRKL